MQIEHHTLYSEDMTKKLTCYWAGCLTIKRHRLQLLEQFHWSYVRGGYGSYENKEKGLKA